MVYSHLCIMHHSYAFKNNLEKAVFEYLKSIDRSLIKGNELWDVIHVIESKIKKLSSEFPRCKPISFNWSNYSDNEKDLILYLNGGSICIFKLHSISSVFPSPF